MLGDEVMPAARLFSNFISGFLQVIWHLWPDEAIASPGNTEDYWAT
jgi:hypothetical protein